MIELYTASTPNGWKASVTLEWDFTHINFKYNSVLLFDWMYFKFTENVQIIESGIIFFSVLFRIGFANFGC